MHFATWVLLSLSPGFLRQLNPGFCSFITRVLLLSTPGCLTMHGVLSKFALGCMMNRHPGHVLLCVGVNAEVPGCLCMLPGFLFAGQGGSTWLGGCPSGNNTLRSRGEFSEDPYLPNRTCCRLRESQHAYQLRATQLCEQQKCGRTELVSERLHKCYPRCWETLVHGKHMCSSFLSDSRAESGNLLE
jgi:hypothetical protein